MKEIKIAIQPFKLSAVTDALQALPGIGGITAIDVRGFGHQRGHAGVEERASGSVNYVPKVMLLLVVPDVTGSLALLADAGHMLTDVGGVGLTTLHPAGHSLAVERRFRNRSGCPAVALTSKPCLC